MCQKLQTIMILKMRTDQSTGSFQWAILQIVQKIKVRNVQVTMAICYEYNLTVRFDETEIDDTSFKH